MSTITTIAELEALYGRPAETSLAKESDRITPAYRAYIDASPFVALATAGPEGLDCSPRGDKKGFLRVVDDKTVQMPDRHGNNRIDSLRNIVRDPRVGLMFLIPGSGNTLRLNGRARLLADPALLASFAVEDKAPRTVIEIAVDAVYFQCARAIVRAELWNPERHIDPKSIPSPGQILASMTENRVGGETYDREWPERAKTTMW